MYHIGMQYEMPCNGRAPVLGVSSHGPLWKEHCYESLMKSHFESTICMRGDHLKCKTLHAF
jgi:hypothetical protein